MFRRAAALGMLTVTTLLALEGVVGAGNGFPPLVVSPMSVQPGQTFTVSGSDCFFPSTLSTDAADVAAANGPAPVGPEVVVTVGFTPPLMQTTNADVETGEWSVTFTVPANTPPGTYDVNATCDNIFRDLSSDVAAQGGLPSYPPGSVIVTAVPLAPPSVPPAPGAPAPPAPGEPAPPAPAVAGTPRTAG